jgi:hypothetical protein
VQAAGQAWGPYTEARMAGFVAEGRVSAATPVSPWSSGPFAPAADMPEFAEVLRARQAGPAPAVTEMQPPAPQRSQPMPQPRTSPEPGPHLAGAVPAAGAARPLLVWAFLASVAPVAFEAALGAFGPCVSIRPGLWLVQARVGSAPLRNALSRRLRDGDALLVVEAPLERAAWFNLDQVSESELRRLWTV